MNINIIYQNSIIIYDNINYIILMYYIDLFEYLLMIIFIYYKMKYIFYYCYHLNTIHQNIFIYIIFHLYQQIFYQQIENMIIGIIDYQCKYIILDILLLIICIVQFMELSNIVHHQYLYNLFFINKFFHKHFKSILISIH